MAERERREVKEGEMKIKRKGKDRREDITRRVRREGKKNYKWKKIEWR